MTRISNFMTVRRCPMCEGTTFVGKEIEFVPDHCSQCGVLTEKIAEFEE